MRTAFVWTCLALALVVPFGFAATSPLLAWRDPIYILAGLAGVIGLMLLLLQPLLAGSILPGLGPLRARRLHRFGGIALLASVVIHVAALWITSPPDVLDALLFASPTPFSLWGVIAMWAVFATALLAAFWRKLRLGPRLWRRAHTALGAIVAAGTVLHALLIDGTMETLSKAGLCALVITATALLLRRQWLQNAGQ